MTKLVLFVLFLSLVLLYSLRTQASFDYYRFSFEFIGAICLTRSCASADLGNISDYAVNMHGFWPQKLSGSIDFCLYNGYDETKLSANLLATLNENWVGAYNPTPGFRSHEWGKHGTCWAQMFYKNDTEFLGQDNYVELMNQFFQLVMQIKENAALEDLFFSNRSQQRIETTLSDLTSLMESRFGVTHFDFVCENINGEQYLTETRVCLDLDYHYRNCPSPIVSCKTGAIIVQAYLAESEKGF